EDDPDETQSVSPYVVDLPEPVGAGLATIERTRRRIERRRVLRTGLECGVIAAAALAAAFGHVPRHAQAVAGAVIFAWIPVTWAVRGALTRRPRIREPLWFVPAVLVGATLAFPAAVGTAKATGLIRVSASVFGGGTMVIAGVTLGVLYGYFGLHALL